MSHIKARSQKFSVASNATQLTDISAILEATEAANNSSGNSSPILLKSASILAGNKTRIMQTLVEDESHKDEDDQLGNRQESKPKLTNVITIFDLIFEVGHKVIRVAW